MFVAMATFCLKMHLKEYSLKATTARSERPERKELETL
jgi:hypothetical protein